MPGGLAVADDFHVFAVECETNRLTWFMDGTSYFTLTPASLPAKTRWVFNQPKFLILNLAVGGGWPGNPDPSTRPPADDVIEKPMPAPDFLRRVAMLLDHPGAA